MTTNPPDSGTDTDTGTDSGTDTVDNTVEAPDQVPAATRTELDGPALENEEMRRGTEDLRSSQDKIEQAREFADQVARATEPEAPRGRGGE